VANAFQYFQMQGHAHKKFQYVVVDCLLDTLNVDRLINELLWQIIPYR